MMFVTTYSKKVSKRKGPDAGKQVTERCIYQTKTLTDMHRHIHRSHSDATTIAHPNEVITDFIIGLKLPKPIIVGGFMVNMAAAA